MSDTDALIALIVRQYDNSAQMADLPAGTATKYTPNTPWVDAMYGVFSRAEVEAARGQDIYLQWHNEGPDGPISRQRIWSFIEGEAPGTVRMEFYSLTEDAAKRAVDAHLYPERASGLTQDDFVVYPDSCFVLWQRTGPDRFEGQMNKMCEIIAQRSGRVMQLTADITVSAARMTYRESGVLEDSSFAFEVPGANTYVFDARL